MLRQESIQKIEQFIQQKPRSMQEIAQMLDKNWRTADRYVEYIKENFGTIDTTTFREGTRGALKIVFWAGVNHQKSSIFQQELEDEVFKGKTKEELRAFDIYQHVNDAKKSVSLSKSLKKSNDELVALLRSAKKTIYCFSGDISFLDDEHSEGTIFTVLEEMAKKGVLIKVICRVDVLSADNIERLLAFNRKYKERSVEIHHREQPLRGNIIDKKAFRLKEIRTDSKKQVYLYYLISDVEWTEWVTKIFWNMFSKSIDAEKRLLQLKNIRQHLFK